MGKREIFRSGIGTFGKFSCHHEVPESLNHSESSCPFCPCLMELALPSSETPYLVMKCHFLCVLLKPFSQLLFMFHWSPFPKTHVSFILFNTFACLWALGRMLFCQLFIWLTALSFCQHKCHLFGDVFSLSTLLRFSLIMNSILFIFFKIVIIWNYLLIILSYILWLPTI